MEWKKTSVEAVKLELERGYHNGGDYDPDAIIRAHELLTELSMNKKLDKIYRLFRFVCKR